MHKTMPHGHELHIGRTAFVFGHEFKRQVQTNRVVGNGGFYHMLFARMLERHPPHWFANLFDQPGGEGLIRSVLVRVHQLEFNGR